MSEAPILRPVAPIKAPDVTPSTLTAKPELTWLPLSALVINDEYQRSLSEKSHRMIRKMVAAFDWGRVKALSVVETEPGTYEVIDGQHTAIAAATHGAVAELPCLITRGKNVQERAADFVGLNRDRLVMTSMQVFFAEHAAGDEQVVDVLQGVKAGGGRVLRSPPPFGRYQPGDLVCIAALKKLADEGGPAYVHRVVAIGVAAKLAPMMASIVKAVSMLIWNTTAPLPDQTIIDILRTYGQEKLIAEAQAIAKREKRPSPIVLVEVMRSKNV